MGPASQERGGSSEHTATFGWCTGPVQAAASRTKQLAIVKHVDQLLGSDAVMTLPTAPGPAPKLKTPLPELDGFRNQLITLTSIASLAGLPQVSLCRHQADTGSGLLTSWPQTSLSMYVHSSW